LRCTRDAAPGCHWPGRPTSGAGAAEAGGRRWNQLARVGVAALVTSGCAAAGHARRGCGPGRTPRRATAEDLENRPSQAAEAAQPLQRPSTPSSSSRGGRPWCDGCLRPKRVCICDALPAAGPLDSVTRVMLFVHPQETKRALTTAPLLQGCLRNLVTLVAKAFPSPEASPELHRQLHEGGRHPVLLYPGPRAEVLTAPPTPLAATGAGAQRPASQQPPRTLVLVDGRWSQAKIMVTRSPWLQQLPRAVVQPRAPSGYVWRQQPHGNCLSTLEAVAEALYVLEGPRGPALREALLAPFRRMVEIQRKFLPEGADRDKNAGLVATGRDAEDAARAAGEAPWWSRRRRRREGRRLGEAAA